MKIMISKYSKNAKRLKSFSVVHKNTVAKIIAINLPFSRFLLISLVKKKWRKRARFYKKLNKINTNY